MSFYITAAIDYANGFPHLGHLYEKLIGDVLTKYYSNFYKNILYGLGLDEHGYKVQNSSLANCMYPKNKGNLIHRKFQLFFKKFNVNYSKYLRTSSRIHYKVVNYVFSFLKKKRYVFVNKYFGYFSNRKKIFLTRFDLIKGYF